MWWRAKTTITSRPPNAPPALDCVRCRRRLVYVESYLSGAGEADQWDLFRCSNCGARYEYRHRTQRMRTAPGHTG
jgi:hypothetical protein